MHNSRPFFGGKGINLDEDADIGGMWVEEENLRKFTFNDPLFLWKSMVLCWEYMGSAGMGPEDSEKYLENVF